MENLFSTQFARFKRKTILHIAILLMLPILLCLINDNWIFNPIPSLLPTQNAIDPWMYHAAFQRYPDLTLLMKNPFITAANLYYLERVGWITVGYLIYHVFPPLLANFVLHLANYYLGVFSLYFLIRLLLNAETALIAGLIMGVYPWYLLSVGYDYLDGYNNSLFLFALLFITLAFIKRRSSFMAVAGAAFAIMVTNNATISVNIVAIGVIVLWLWWQHTSRKLSDLFRAGLVFGIGSFLMLVLLGAIYFIITHEWNYWRFTVYFSQSYPNGLFGDPELRGAKIRNLIYQINPFSLHVFPLFTALIAAIRLARSRTLNPSQRNYLKVIAFMFVVNYTIWTVLDNFWLPYLTMYLYASYLIPLTFLLFAGVVHSYTERFGFRLSYALGFVAAICIPLLVAAFTPLLNAWQYDTNVNFVLILVLILGSILFFINRHPAFILLIGFGFAILHVLSFPFTAVYSSRGIGRDNFSRIQGLMDGINEHYPTADALTQVWGWFDVKSVMERPGYTPLATYTNLGLGFWWGRLLDLQNFFPTSPVEAVIILEQGQTIEEIQESLKPYDYILAVESIDKRIPDYPIYFTRLTPIPIDSFDRRYKWYSKDIPWYATLLPTGDVVVETGPSDLTTVQLELPKSNGDVLAEVCVINYYTVNYAQKTQLHFNNQVLDSELVMDSNDCLYLFKATIPEELFNQAATKQFGISTDLALIDTFISSRFLGVTVSWVQFSQESNSVDTNP